jgi:hypothetical protein
MKKSRIFMTAAGLVLAATAVFATKASKKFNAPIQTAKVNGETVVIKASTAIFTGVSSSTLLPLGVSFYTTAHNTNIFTQEMLTDAGGSGTQVYARPSGL